MLNNKKNPKTPQQQNNNRTTTTTNQLTNNPLHSSMLYIFSVELSLLPDFSVVIS